MTQHIETADQRKALFGFWIYILTDCVLFATLFAVYAVLKDNLFGSPGPQELFNSTFVMAETLLLLTSSLTAGLAVVHAHAHNKSAVLRLLIVTGLLGGAFLGMELYEFSHMLHAGHDWTASAFLSAYFVLVGTHGLHITAGLCWLIMILIYIGKKGLTPQTTKRLLLFSLFWHFLDIIWIFIFSIVYMLGIAS